MHETIAHEHSRRVHRMVEELSTQPGVFSPPRETREAMLARSPDRDAEQWVPGRLRARIPELDRDHRRAHRLTTRCAAALGSVGS
jgi:hypothetical protein